MKFFANSSVSFAKRYKLTFANEYYRCYSQNSGFQSAPDPTKVKADYIGPPDNNSNLRPIVRFIPKNESDSARELRLKRIEVETWNQDFWTRHNKRFYEEKEIFINLHKQNGIENISADTMSVFYKHFLDKNKKIHFYYNVSWYLKNFDLLTIAAKVSVVNLWARIRPKKIDVSNKD